MNDLDLEVVAPDGNLYRGNRFDDGESMSGTPDADKINNVEGVYLRRRRRANISCACAPAKLPEDARTDTPVIDQDFALVISGSVLTAGSSVLALDRSAYTAPGQMRGQAFRSRPGRHRRPRRSRASSTETNGESLIHTRFCTMGRLTGGMATATGPALSRRPIASHAGDTITVSYFDASFAAWRTVAAVRRIWCRRSSRMSRATNEFGEVVVTWRTDEPANSIVRYGTNTSLAFAATNSDLVTDHSVSIAGLTPGQDLALRRDLDGRSREHRDQ